MQPTPHVQGFFMEDANKLHLLNPGAGAQCEGAISMMLCCTAVRDTGLSSNCAGSVSLPAPPGLTKSRCVYAYFSLVPMQERTGPRSAPSQEWTLAPYT